MSPSNDRKSVAELAFSSREAELCAISRWMYENPETAFREFASAERLARFLETNGFDVSLPAYELDTAFEANVGASGPRVVICCEYDALPEIGHACGHNIIATAALGAGVAIAGLVDELGIRVTVLGTPAEEEGGGKVELIRAGAFEDAAAAMMIHPGPLDQLDPSCQAREMYSVEYFGKETHAAYAPHAGLNALDAFVQAYMNVGTLRQSFMAGDRVHCIIDRGGDACNVIPAYTLSTWSIRTEHDNRLGELGAKVKACFEAAAIASGCRVEITRTEHPYLNMHHNAVLTALFKGNAELLGRSMPTEAETGVGGGSSDMGNVSQLVPSIHPIFAIDCGDAVNHQRDFADATVTTSGDRAIRDGALAMAWTIIDVALQDLWDALRG